MSQWDHIPYKLKRGLLGVVISQELTCYFPANFFVLDQMLDSFNGLVNVFKCCDFMLDALSGVLQNKERKVQKYE